MNERVSFHPHGLVLRRVDPDPIDVHWIPAVRAGAGVFTSIYEYRKVLAICR